MKQVIMFESSDGRLWRTQAACKDQQQIIDLDELISAYFEGQPVVPIDQVTDMVLALWPELSALFVKDTVQPLVAPAPAEKINWFDEYPELSVKVISDAMDAAAYEIAMTSHALCNSDEYKSLFAIELVGILDLAVAVHTAGKKAASAAYSAQFNPPSY